MNNKYIIEFKNLVKIGIPIFGSQMSYMLMGATDTIIAGRASATDLAGLAVGTAFANTLWFAACGVIFSVTPIVAQLYGAKKYKEIGQKLREILWIAGLLGFLLACIIYNSTQPVIENLSAEQKKKAVEQEKLTLKHFDAALNSFEGVMKHIKQEQQAKKLSSKSVARIKKVIKALDEMEKWLNTAVVTTIFSNPAKDQQQYNQKIAGLFNKEGDEIKRIKDRIIFIRNALKSYKK